jgi:hypothetical protein
MPLSPEDIYQGENAIADVDDAAPRGRGLPISPSERATAERATPGGQGMALDDPTDAELEEQFDHEFFTARDDRRDGPAGYGPPRDEGPDDRDADDDSSDDDEGAEESEDT